ncbi:MAG: Rpn family recombination-promoting nuclease/putative transposase [Lachnospiraceae bacterium]|nr:Rpn family recombination-promoting nuclease/putative transposase [Lachnospiraceae bacterium]
MSEQRKMRSFDELRFRDDFMFGKIMEDPGLCREVLERLLGRRIGELTEVQTQREFRYTVDGKPIRLDVYNEDSEGTVYDTEMENLGHKKVEDHQLPKRSRYYQGAIDIDYMDKGNSYKRLPESNVMFICTFDPFGHGLPRYTFRERCDEKAEVTLNDGSLKVFYNCCYKGEDIPDGLRKLYDYVENGYAGDDLTKRIDAAVVKGRTNAIWRTQYMKEWVLLQDARDEGVEEGMEKGREEGRKEGIKLANTERIEDMLRRGKTVDEIVDFCGYPPEVVQKVYDELSLPVN